MIGNFLISGMFRSGTTLLARMLHSHPSVVCASDPFAPIFKSYRNSVAREFFPNFDPSEPIHDYYMNWSQNLFFSELQNKDFTQPICSDELEILRKNIENQCLPYSPLIIPFLKNLSGATYAEVFISAREIIRQAYGKEECLIGSKEVWVSEFDPHFRALWTKGKVIHLIRDPRAVVASCFASGARYPLLFLIRQWRKIATLGFYYSSSSNDVKLIRFEDLLENSVSTVSKICNFFSIDFHENMLDARTYLDGAGHPWQQNTSYSVKIGDKKKDGFDKNTLTNWKMVLNQKEIRMIEHFCSREMRLLGYEISNQSFEESICFSDLFDYQDDETKLADWIIPYSKYDNPTEIMAELHRISLLNSSEPQSDKIKKVLCLKAKMFDCLSGNSISNL